MQKRKQFFSDVATRQRREGAYLVQSNAEGFGVGFREQQIDVSERLLKKIIYGIEEWHKLNHRGTKK